MKIKKKLRKIPLLIKTVSGFTKKTQKPPIIKEMKIKKKE
jgi:hypothetical protein